MFEEREGEYLKGHTANYILVKARMDDSNINKICDVEIKDFEEECLKDWNVTKCNKKVNEITHKFPCKLKSLVV